MEMKQLEIFVAVVKCSSFSKAADAIYLSQSSISTYIASLEKELNAQLLVRSARQVYPTPVGRDFFKRAMHILSMRDDALGCIRCFDEESHGELHILASTVPAQFLLPQIVSEFRLQYPNITFRVQQADSQATLQGILDYQFEFGFVGTTPNEERLEKLTILEDNIMLIAPRSFGIAKNNANFDLVKTLSEMPVIMRENGSGTRQATERILQSVGISFSELNIAAYFYDTQSVISAVAQGVGVAFVSEVAVNAVRHRESIQVLGIWSGMFARQMYMVYQNRLSLSPIQHAFLDFMSRAQSELKAWAS